jgi:tyrosyl-tRNA synthetase
VLAFEATRITHGNKEARLAHLASWVIFNSRPVDANMFPSSTIPRMEATSDTSAIPRYKIPRKDLESGVQICATCAKAGLTSSMSETRRLIEQGGIYINDRQVKSVDEKITVADFSGGNELRVRKGKKKYLIIEMD